MHSLCADLLLQRLDRPHAALLPLPLHRRIYDCVRHAILDGSLPPATRLPSSRELALELAMSRNTVTHAYDQLVTEGYLRSLTGSGTYVADVVPDGCVASDDEAALALPRAASPALLSTRGEALIANASGGAGASRVPWGAFMPGVPDVLAFPHAKFARLLQKNWQAPAPETLGYASEGGLPALKSALCEHLRQSRSVRCTPEQIVVTEGTHHAMDLLVRLLGDPGDEAWVEEPGYGGTRRICEMSGLRVRPLQVDAEGLQFPLTPYEQAPRFIVLTPSHQYPLGSIMSIGRRASLLEFATRRGSWIVEDDYDSEFRFSGKPVPALQGMVHDAPVLYLGTFSKTVYPGLRLGYVVLPRALVEPFRVAQAELFREGHLPLQGALAEFIQTGEYAGHIRRMRLLYAARRTFVLALVRRWLGPQWLHPFDSDAGLHLVLSLPDRLDDAAVAQSAQRLGVQVRPLSSYYARGAPAERGLVLGYASMPESQMAPAFETLVNCIRAHLG
jgi:GntR family transcriptional regulator/MocR family aminotransferase